MATSTTTKKITKRDRFNQLLALDAVKSNADLVIFIEHEIELLDKKNAGDKKPTAKQIENDGIKATILTVMEKSPEHLFTVTELCKADADLAELSNQRVSALLRQLIDAGKVKKIEDKRKSYFQIAE